VRAYSDEPLKLLANPRCPLELFVTQMMKNLDPQLIGKSESDRELSESCRGDIG